jgi:hypothetical protein
MLAFEKKTAISIAAEASKNAALAVAAACMRTRGIRNRCICASQRTRLGLAGAVLTAPHRETGSAMVQRACEVAVGHSLVFILRARDITLLALLTRFVDSGE